MLDKDKVAALVRAYFPDADNQTVLRVTEEIRSSVIPTIHSFARQPAVREREAEYLDNGKI
jgi:hypothetical protein